MGNRKLLAFILALTFTVIPSSLFGTVFSQSNPQNSIRYQVDEDYPPFEFSVNGEVYGFDIDLSRLMFSGSRYNVEYSSGVWKNVFERLKNGDIDTCGLIAVTDERKKYILYSNPVIQTYRSVYTKKDVELKSIDELKKLKVGVQKSDYSEKVLRDKLKTNNYIAYDNLEKCIAALQNGEIDAILGNQEVTNHFLVKHQLTNVIVPQITNLYPVNMAYGISKKRPELVDFINRQLVTLQKSGLYEQLFQKYFYSHSTYYKTAQTRYIVILVVVLLSVLAIAALITLYIIHQLKHIVNKTTLNLSEERTWLRTTLSSIGDGVIATDTEGYITFMNPVAESLTGYVEEEAIGKPIEDILDIYDSDSGEKTEVSYKSFMRDNSPAAIKSYNLMISRQQSEYMIMSTVSPICDESRNVVGVVLVFQDISEKKQAEAMIHHQAYYDSLTDLPNRKLFSEHLGKAIYEAGQNSSQLAVLFIDLDYFKNINDTLGHNIGDLLLQQVSKRLVLTLGEDMFISRMGGDEFTILLPSINSMENVSKLALNVLDSLCIPFTINEHQLFVTASIGISIFPDDGNETEIILKHADAALYNAKEQGRNNYQVYSSTKEEISFQKFSIVKSLRTALEKDELVLHYQPKISSVDSSIVGLETLVRWQHPEKGLIYPGTFIPIAEETGLIKLLDNWVLKNACMQFKSWVDMGYNTPKLAVNLSAYQFRHQNLVDTIKNVLEETKLDPSYLEIEITETTAMENIDFTVKTLHSLIEMGINISIDDFGTGYSSLNYLKHFPVHLLKIDRSFISDITDNNNTKTIVKAIIEVAHSLNMRVTAEGVETQEQLELLKTMKCDEIQGYLISKPLPVHEIEKLIKRNK